MTRVRPWPPWATRSGRSTRATVPPPNRRSKPPSNAGPGCRERSRRGVPLFSDVGTGTGGRARAQRTPDGLLVPSHAPRRLQGVRVTGVRLGPARSLAIAAASSRGRRGPYRGMRNLRQRRSSRQPSRRVHRIVAASERDARSMRTQPSCGPPCQRRLDDSTVRDPPGATAAYRHGRWAVMLEGRDLPVIANHEKELSCEKQ